MRLLFTVLCATLLTACSTTAANLSSSVFYKRDIKLNVNGYYTDGVIVVPKAPSYRIAGSIKGKFDFLLIRSCHREYTVESEDTDFVYTYEPVPGLEDNRACPLEVIGAEKVKGRHSFAFIDFESPHDTLPARSQCNGKDGQWDGVANCQAPTGLYQKIIFPVEVYTAVSEERCKIPEPADLKTYEFKIPARHCVHKFMEKAAPHRTFRLNTFGYEQVIVRDL